jgi:dolichol-phosphate mannosyltransferase
VSENDHTKSNPLISVVLSFRNEEAVILELVQRLQKAFRSASLRYELIFVNDSSSDSSLEFLEEQRKDDPCIKVINMSRRFGITPCVLAGFARASGDAVVYMDSDLQDPPELIPKLVEKWQTGVDVVHTVRTKRLGESSFKMWLTRQAYRIINAVSSVDIIENAGDFKLLSRRAANIFIQLPEYDPFMRGLSAWVGFKQDSVPYERDPRHSGTTKFSLWSSMNPYEEFVRGITFFSSAPLYFSLFVGFAISCGSFLYLLYITATKLFWGMHRPGWAALMVTFLFLGGTILFTIGILGVYVGRIYHAIRNRPRYIIESTLGFENTSTE